MASVEGVAGALFIRLEPEERTTERAVDAVAILAQELDAQRALHLEFELIRQALGSEGPREHGLGRERPGAAAGDRDRLDALAERDLGNFSEGVIDQRHGRAAAALLQKQRAAFGTLAGLQGQDGARFDPHVRAVERAQVVAHEHHEFAADLDHLARCIKPSQVPLARGQFEHATDAAHEEAVIDHGHGFGLEPKRGRVTRLDDG